MMTESFAASRWVGAAKRRWTHPTWLHGKPPAGSSG